MNEPIAAPLLDNRDRWREAVGRAFALAYRWEGAHGSSSFLVRAAGAELRDALDGELDTEHERAGASSCSDAEQLPLSRFYSHEVCGLDRKSTRLNSSH